VGGFAPGEIGTPDFAAPFDHGRRQTEQFSRPSAHEQHQVEQVAVSRPQQTSHGDQLLLRDRGSLSLITDRRRSNSLEGVDQRLRDELGQRRPAKQLPDRPLLAVSFRVAEPGNLLGDVPEQQFADGRTG